MENDTIREIAYEFLFVFHCKYVSIFVTYCLLENYSTSRDDCRCVGYGRRTWAKWHAGEATFSTDCMTDIVADMSLW